MPRTRPPVPVGELALIRGLRRRFRTPASRAVALGIGDDCALLTPRPGQQIAVTTDLLIEGRHFRRDTHTARSAGHRCLARGLSDLAAMGATPLACFLSLAIPSATACTAVGRRWLNAFFAGLHALALENHVPIAGGDTGQAPGEHLLADIVLLGEVAPARALRRAGARPGDAIWVSGALGGAAAELEAMLRRAAAHPRPSRTHGPQSFPQPRLALGRALGRRHPALVTACIDLSDGLSTDLLHLCEESGVSAQIDVSCLPLHPLAARHGRARALAHALHGGEDYELLFTTRPGARLPRTLAGVSVTRIGTLLPPRRRSPVVTLLDQEGHESPLAPAGFEHLRAPN